jgi:Spy/CpxP family protein refolding chaperone
MNLIRKSLILLIILPLVLNIAFAQEAKTQKPIPSKNDKIKTRVSYLTEELNLTDKQVYKIQEILTRHMEEFHKKMDKLSYDELEAEARRMRMESNAEIKDVLTAEQKAKFKSMSEEVKTNVRKKR